MFVTRGGTWTHVGVSNMDFERILDLLWMIERNSGKLSAQTVGPSITNGGG